MENKKALRIGVIGGSQGMGKWLCSFFGEMGFQTSFSSHDGASQYNSNVHLASENDVVVLAVPISKMEEVLAEIFPHISGKTLIDVCSVKSGVVEGYRQLGRKYPEVTCKYLSIHPMFAPSAKTIQGQSVLFNEVRGLTAAEVAFWKTTFSEKGANIQDIDYQEHDRLMGLIQGLNHFNVFVSAKTLAHMGIGLDFIKTLSSPSYRIFLLFYTRYVLQNPKLYAEIQIFNPYVKEVTRLFMKEATQLLQVIENKDFEGFENYVKEIQPFFRDNAQDSVMSDKLIQALGQLLAHTPDQPQAGS